MRIIKSPLQELFNNPVPFTLINKSFTGNVYNFSVGDLEYRCDIANMGTFQYDPYNLGKEVMDHTWDISFALKKGRGSDYGITNTGNAPIIFSTVVSIIKSFIKTMAPSGELFFSFSAKENSRQKLYKSFALSIARFFPGAKYIMSTKFEGGEIGYLVKVR